MKKYFKSNIKLLILTIFFSGASSLSYVMISLLLQKIVDTATNNDISTFVKILNFSILYFPMMGILHFLYALYSKKLTGVVIKELRGEIFNNIFKKNMEDFNRINTADYLSLINNDVKLIEDNFIVPLLLILKNAILFIASLIVMIYFDLTITIAMLVAILFLIIVPGLFGKALQYRQNNYSKKLSDFLISSKELFAGFEIIQSYNMIEYAKKTFNKKNSETFENKYAVDKLSSVNEAVAMIMAIGVQVMVIFLSAYFIITGRITVGVLLGVTQVSSNLANPLLVLFENLPKIKSTYNIIDKLNHLGEEYDECIECDTNIDFKRCIRMDHVTFTYNKINTILEDINFSFYKDKKYVIVGKSGCGKSTLIKLLAGYYSDYDGNIFYDDRNINNFSLQKLSILCAIIHQNVYMFDDSIYNNICLYNNYLKDDLENILQVSGVSAFLRKSNSGIESSVGENGNNLSGGQRQRIAVARALIRRKPLLILDEGTSAIDHQSAYDIESGLLQMDDLTLITITHNMNDDLLEKYDTVIYMNNGKIVESGSFKELMHKKSDFFEFYNIKKFESN